MGTALQLTDFSPSSAVVARAEPDVGDPWAIPIGSSRVGLSRAPARWHRQGASFDKFRMRGSLYGTKKSSSS
jgi:hypothetical protein